LLLARRETLRLEMVLDAAVPSSEMSEFEDFAPSEERARSFGSIADHYARFRPAPPPEAVDWVLEKSPRDAVDLGAGTGALTELLAERTEHVIAVEPDPEMREVLHERLPAVDLVGAVTEALPFGEATFDVATAASSWHWMDPVRAPIEVGRVLRPGGSLAMLWNGADRSVDWVERLLGPNDPDSTSWPAPIHRHEPDMPAGAPFNNLEFEFFRWTTDFSVEDLVGLMGSYSRVFTLPPRAREKLLGRVEERARALVDKTGSTVIALPMRCACWRVTRNR
jgi:SAM-dependent methyltransferase